MFQRGSEFVGVPVFAGDSFFAVPAPSKKIEQPQCRSSKPVTLIQHVETPFINQIRRKEEEGKDLSNCKGKSISASPIQIYCATDAMTSIGQVATKGWFLYRSQLLGSDDYVR